MTALSHSHGNAASLDCGHCRTHALYVPLPAVAGVGAGRGPALLLLASATGVRCRMAFVTYLLAAPTHTRYTAAARVTLTRAPLVTTSLPHVPQVTTK